MDNLLNGGFEMDWAGSHQAMVVTEDAIYYADVGNIFTPDGWTTWFAHYGEFAQPEVSEIHAHQYLERVRSGSKAMKLFTFHRRHDAGFFQAVNVEPGTKLKLSAYAHAWSNHEFDHEDDPEWSEGAGYDCARWLTVPPLNGDPQNDAKGNFTFVVGIDPTGGVDPYADTVVWGDESYIYNCYHRVPSIEVEAQVPTVTVFLRSRTLWPFKHNDAYWDDVVLEIVEEPHPDECRGHPRVQYERVYNVIPSNATESRAVEIFLDGWRKAKQTAGGSYDDAGVGDLDKRTAVLWDIPVDLRADLQAFYEEYYSGVHVQFAGGNGNGNGSPSPSPGVGNTISLHVQGPEAGLAEFVAAVKPESVKLCHCSGLAGQLYAVSPETLIVYRKVYNAWHDYIYGGKTVSDFLDWIAPEIQEIDNALGGCDFAVECLNETIATGAVEDIRRVVEFESEFAYRLTDRFSNARPVLLNTAVGNPQHGAETEMLVPAARAAVATGGYIGYHSYWPAIRDQCWLESDWMHYAGRWTEWDKVFRSNGVYPHYLLTEGGPIGGTVSNGVPYLNAGAGWRHPSCLNENWEKAKAQILRFDELARASVPGQDGRYHGIHLFTVCAGGGEWTYFKYRQPQLESLAS